MSEGEPVGDEGERAAPRPGARVAPFVFLVTLALSYGAVREGMAAFGPQDAKPRPISPRASADELPNGAWVTVRARPTARSLWRQGAGERTIVAYALEESEGRLVAVMPLAAAPVLGDPKIWRRDEPEGNVEDRRDDGGALEVDAAAAKATGELAPETVAYLQDDHELTGIITSPEGAMSNGNVEVGDGLELKLTGLGSYCSVATCPPHVRALAVGKSPASRWRVIVKAVTWALLALLAFAFALRLARRPRTPEPLTSSQRPWPP